MAILKYGLIFLLAGLVSGLVLLVFSEELSSTVNHKNTVQGQELDSGFGKIRVFESRPASSGLDEFGNEMTFVESNLGFEISRPNTQWKFDTNIDDVQGSPAKSNNKLIGGLYLSKENEKSFFVGVFDLARFDAFDLPDYVQTLVNNMKAVPHSLVTINKISPERNWSIFGARVNLDNGNSIYGEQVLEIHNNKLYMLQYTGQPPDLIDSSSKEEIREIIDSFRPFD